MYLRFGIEGATELSRKLNALAEDATDWSESLEQAGDDLVSVFSNEVFTTEGDEIEAPWAPLSENYAKVKARKYPGQGILQATGEMRGSFYRVFDTSSLQIRNNADWFKYHQSNQPRTKLPRRVMMKLTENLKESVVKVFQERWIEIITS